MIHFVMMKTTMLNATLIMELVVIIGQSMVKSGHCGTTSALIVNVLKSNIKILGHLLYDDMEKHVLY